jgi:predicted secreted hydrolase
MIKGSSFENLIADAGRAVQGAIDIFTDVYAGKADTLRNGSEFDPVSLPRDLAAHADVQTEWWYYTGHVTTTSGREFGFELVFFKRRTDLDNFSVVPLRLLGNPFYFAHFAVTDIDRKTFRYAHRKSANGPMDLPAVMTESHYYLRLGNWSVRQSGKSHVVRASIGDTLIFEATLTPEKPAVLNGKNGVSYKDESEASRYFSYTRLSVEGDLTVDGKVEHFTGSAWMDREFGTWTPTERQKGWDWFSIQLDDNSELMCYQLRDGEDKVSPFSSGTFVDRDGQSAALSANDFVIETRDKWTSANSGAEYPSGWKIRVPSRSIELEITPVMRDQELDTRGTTMIVYWEGSCRVIGTVGPTSVKGRAYVELVGYDRSHEQPNLAQFLMGSRLDLVTRIFS